MDYKVIYVRITGLFVHGTGLLIHGHRITCTRSKKDLVFLLLLIYLISSWHAFRIFLTISQDDLLINEK